MINLITKITISLFLIVITTSCGVGFQAEFNSQISSQASFKPNTGTGLFEFEGQSTSVAGASSLELEYEWTFNFQDGSDISYGPCVINFTAYSQSISSYSNSNSGCSYFLPGGVGHSVAINISPLKSGPIVVRYCLRVRNPKNNKIDSKNDCGIIEGEPFRVVEPSISSPVNNFLTNMSSLNIEGGCEINHIVRVEGGIQSPFIDGNCSPSGTYSIPITLSNLDGLKNIEVSQYNPMGSFSLKTNRIVIYDTTALAPTSSIPSFGNLTSRQISGGCEPGASVNIAGDIQSPVNLVCSQLGTFSGSVSFTASDGVKNISLNQTDIVGNISSPLNLNHTVDQAAPTAIVSSLTPSITWDNPIVFTVTFNEDIEGLVAANLSVANGSVLTISGSGRIYDVSIGPSSDGIVSVQVLSNQVRDLASNTNIAASNSLARDYFSMRPMVTTWRVGAVGYGDGGLSISLPMVYISNGYNFTVDWGDGSSSVVTSNTDPDRSHSYAAAGDYTVTISGMFGAFYIPGSAGHMNKLIEVNDLGKVRWRSFYRAFYGCQNLRNVSGGEFPLVRSMREMFFNASEVSPATTSWDVSKITDMSGMFYGVRTNPDVSGWDVSSVTNMHRMFAYTSNTNPDVSNWDVSNVTNFTQMFGNSNSTNPDVSLWDVSSATTMRSMFISNTIANPNVSNWNVSNVTDMTYLFSRASSAIPDVSSWDTSSATSMGYLFAGATSADPDLRNWNFSSVTNIRYMFSSSSSTVFNSSGMSNLNYSRFLVRLLQTNPNGALNIGSIPHHFQAFSTVARSDLLTNGWSFADRGAE